MQLDYWLLAWNLLIWTLAIVLTAVYLRGRQRLARFVPAIATRTRAGAWFAGWLFLLAAFSFPLPELSSRLLFARMGQMVAIYLLGVPFLWLALPFHTLAWGTPAALRKRITRAFVRRSRWTVALALLCAPVTAWFLYMSGMLIWHEPGFVNWMMVAHWRRMAGALMLLGCALLFWQQITSAGPRRLARATPLARIGMVIGAEIPNLIAGITIAFGTTSLYAYYAQHAATMQVTIGALSQQTLAGALTWIFGSIVYIITIVLLVNNVFRREGIDRAQPLANWDADDKFIAPGLENRLLEQGREQHDWRDY